VLTFFDDAVTKTSNHHFSLSLSHNDSHTRFSFLFQPWSARGFDIAHFKESGAEFHRELAARALQALLSISLR